LIIYAKLGNEPCGYDRVSFNFWCRPFSVRGTHERLIPVRCLRGSDRVREQTHAVAALPTPVLRRRARSQERRSPLVLAPHPLPGRAEPAPVAQRPALLEHSRRQPERCLPVGPWWPARPCFLLGGVQQNSPGLSGSMLCSFVARCVLALAGGIQ
jgi:hypothetical protein